MSWYKVAEAEGRAAFQAGKPCKNPYPNDAQHSEAHAGWIRGWNREAHVHETASRWARPELRHDPELDKRLTTWNMPL